MTNGNPAFFLAKLDPSGNVLWAKAPDTSYSTITTAVAVDYAGNAFVTGSFSRTNVIGGTSLVSQSILGSFSSDVMLLKFDKEGNLLWAKQAGGNQPDSGQSVAVDQFGNAYVLAFIESTNAVFGDYTFRCTNSPNPDIIVAKYNPSGTVVWAKQFGSEGIDSGLGIAADSPGNCYITGFFRGTNFYCGSFILTNSSNAELFVAKLDANGNPLWAKASQGNYTDASYSIAADQFGNAYVGGYFQGNTMALDSLTLTNYETNLLNDADAFVAKFDRAGNVLWAAQASGPSTQEIFGLALDPWANVYATGWTMGTNVLYGTHPVTNSYIDIVLAKLESDYPLLKLNLSNHLARVSWPVRKNPFTLQYSTNLQDWFSVAQATSTNNGQNVVTDSATGVRFYRATSQ
jgi:hypothetical protein